MAGITLDTDAIRARVRAELEARLLAAEDPEAEMAKIKAEHQERMARIRLEVAASHAALLETDRRIAELQSLCADSRASEATDLPHAIFLLESGLLLCEQCGLGVGHRRSCWERLWVLYRKAGRLTDERDMLMSAIPQLVAKACPETLIRRYDERLHRVQALIAKSQTPGF